MTEPQLHYEPVPVHLASSDVHLDGASPRPRRCRRALKTNTFTLSAANPTQLVLPQADTRVEAWLCMTTFAGSLFIAATQAGAAGQGGGAAIIPAILTSGQPYWFPVNTTDQVWISAAAFPTVVSVLAVYEEYE